SGSSTRSSATRPSTPASPAGSSSPTSIWLAATRRMPGCTTSWSARPTAGCGPAAACSATARSASSRCGASSRSAPETARGRRRSPASTPTGAAPRERRRPPVSWQTLAVVGWLVVAAAAGQARAEPSAPSGSPSPVTVAPPAPAREVPGYVLDVLAEIERRHGEPPAGYVGGRRFENRERRLPRGVYREYDVHRKVPGQDRGPERIGIEQRSGEAWDTADHHRTCTAPTWPT